MATTTSTKKKGGLYGGIMDDFFNSSPEAEDAEGRSIKQAFQGNMAQSVLDSSLAKDLGEFNSGIAQENMTHQADLEQRNQSALMKDEFNYGLESMGAQFKYGEQGAQNQHERDLGMLSATGQEQRLNISAQGQQDRLGRITDGEQTRLTAHVNNASLERRQTGMNEANKYIQDSASNASRDVATTQKDSALGTANIQKDSATETTGMRTQADVDIASIEKDSAMGTAQIGADAGTRQSEIAAGSANYGADKSVDIANIGAKGTLDNTKETGNQTRKTMGTENQLKAKDRADMHRYARNTARAM
tara:strand:- start:190 stop:1101 length:912 start_codon:yes stop_codon:yes gene_type:complete